MTEKNVLLELQFRADTGVLINTTVELFRKNKEYLGKESRQMD